MSVSHDRLPRRILVCGAGHRRNACAAHLLPQAPANILDQEEMPETARLNRDRIAPPAAMAMWSGANRGLEREVERQAVLAALPPQHLAEVRVRHDLDELVA